MKKVLALLFLAILVSACSPGSERDDSWTHLSKFRRGDIVIFRVDGDFAVVAGADCSDRTDCIYRVKDRHGRTWPAKEFEIAKSPQRTCKDSQSTNDWLAYQEGDKAAEARCRQP
jgi:hypothetical protein